MTKENSKSEERQQYQIQARISKERWIGTNLK